MFLFATPAQSSPHASLIDCFVMPPGYTSKLATIPEDTTDASIQDTSRPKTPPNVSYFTSECE